MKKAIFTLNPGNLTLADIRQLQSTDWNLQLDAAAIKKIDQAAQFVETIAQDKNPVYGINTGVGLLANQSIAPDKIQQLQQNLILSHATGTGALLNNQIVRLILLTKINSLARAYSGVRLLLINQLIALFNHEIYPHVPSKGSVGASGDLAPLAHLSLALLGEGNVHYQEKIIPAKKALARAGVQPLKLAAKEGLALVNGLQVSSSIGLHALLLTERIFSAAILAGCLTIDASRASYVPFDARIHELRQSHAQQRCAQLYRDLLSGSKINQSHQQCTRVQDPYSLRCQPQVMGACLQQIQFALDIFINEANAVSDNPVIFIQQQQILSGGNFHGEAIAMAADNMALAIAEIGAISERRIALLMDKNFSDDKQDLFMYSPIDTSENNAKQDLILFLLENLMRKSYKRYNGNCYTKIYSDKGFDTHAWEMVSFCKPASPWHAGGSFICLDRRQGSAQAKALRRIHPRFKGS